jgi:hypothetical protein
MSRTKHQSLWKACLLGAFLLQLAIAIAGAIPARAEINVSRKSVAAQPPIQEATATLTPYPVEVVETSVLTATATLIPLPSITFQYPHLTKTVPLLSLQHEPAASPIEKGGVQHPGLKLGRLWPLGLLLALWLVLAGWFVLAQRF